MPFQEKLEKMLPVIREVPLDEVKKHRIPPKFYAMEATNLYYLALQDKEKLLEDHLDWNHAEMMYSLSLALRELCSNWLVIYFDRAEDRIAWEESLEEANKLFDDVYGYLRFHFRHDQSTINQLRQIADGNRHADTIQDFNDLAVVARNLTPRLEELNFDFYKLDKLTKYAYDLNILYAKARRSNMPRTEQRELRDKAYHLLRIHTREVIDHGNYTFRDDEKHAANYAIHYLPSTRRKPEDVQEDIEESAEELEKDLVTGTKFKVTRVE
ncbi:hypothetical protein QA601_10470 [Chitinispirillales bacterium ANBcel5]|uniref:hypothetical protein n=1 Tax=Cellulosispirillum alkaliphilum TaxID=3039283 RepID=UPI002A57B13A|nr:hypothetical protein [Chitinispirillales bacterium ANBcel5]